MVWRTNKEFQPLPQNPVIAEDDLIKSICKDSFYDFVREFWETVIAEDPIWNWHIEYLCKQLQSMAERVLKNEPKLYDLVINISPGSTKSTIVSIMYHPWLWTRKKSIRTICGSYTAPLALDLSRRSRMIVESDKYKRLFRVKLKDDQNTKTLWANNRGGSRQAVGTGNQITGSHAHVLIVDDPIDPKGAKSDAEIKVANEWMRETLSTRKIDKAVTPTILIMQRLHQNDPAGNILTQAKEGKRRVKHICLPAEICAASEVKPKRLERFYKDGLMDPVRISRLVLKESEDELGQYGYAGQYLQNPVPLGGGMFKSDRIVIDHPSFKFVSVVRYWDKAGTQDGGKFSVGVCMGLDIKKRYWILDLKRHQYSSERREALILQTAKIDLAEYGKLLITATEQEPGSGGKESAENTVRNLAGFRVRVDRPVGDKVLRADPFSVQVNGGNVSMVPATWNNVYTEEFKFFPNSTYKDQVDASSGAFSILSKPNIRVGPI